MEGGGERGAILRKGGKGRKKMGKNAATEMEGGGERDAILKKRGREKNGKECSDRGRSRRRKR